MRYQVISPDGLPIAPDSFDTHEEAEQALALWCLRFAGQGFYAAVAGRIPVDQLAGACQIEAVDEDEDEEEIDEEEAETEPCEDDLTTEDHTTFYQYGRRVLWSESRWNGHGEPTDHWYYSERGDRFGDVLGDFGDDHAAAVRAYMERVQFWPACWFISDHGNAHLMDLNKR